jgi:O-antigen/teichoic acid export membrane protein
LVPSALKGIVSKEILWYTSVVFLGNFIQFLCYRMDIWFINYYHTKEEVGLYAFATKVSQLWWVMPQILAMFFFPLTAIKQYDKKYFNKILKALFLLSFLTAMAAVLIYRFFIQYFTGGEYFGSYLAFIFLLPGVVFFSINIVLAAKFAGEGKVNINLKASLLCFVTIVLSDICLIPKYGINGAAIASSIAYCCSSLFAIYKYKNDKQN